MRSSGKMWRVEFERSGVEPVVTIRPAYSTLCTAYAYPFTDLEDKAVMEILV
jgi:hypothetical protein